MRILVIKLSSLGDVFHSLPAVHCLRAGLNAEITWVTQKEYVELVRCFKDVSHVIPFDRHHFRATWRSFLKELRAVDYDLVVDFQGLLKSAMIARAAHARRRIGPSFQREGAFLLYSEVAGERNKARHAVEENLDVVRHLGLPVLPPQFPLAFPAQPLDAPRPRIGLVTTSRWSTKNWPAASFAQAARLIQERRSATFYLLGSAADTKQCDDIASSIGPAARNLAGRTSIVQMGGVIQQLDLLITNDSGPMHMAAALGIPCLAIFGPTEPARTGPYGSIHQVLRTDLTCQPCFSRTCRVGEMPCLTGVTPEQVAQAALERLA